MTTVLIVVAGSLGILAGWWARAAIARRDLAGARLDPLTGLPARGAWTARAQRILRRGSHIVAIIDLDHFKQVNDTWGHAAGDHLLTVQASRMASWTAEAPGGACGRLSGDEFAIITGGAAHSERVAALCAALSEPVALPGGTVIRPSASIGVAPVDAGAVLSAVLAAADRAMYQAKRAGGAQWHLAAQDHLRPPDAAPVRRVRHHGADAAEPAPTAGSGSQ